MYSRNRILLFSCGISLLRVIYISKLLEFPFKYFCTFIVLFLLRYRRFLYSRYTIRSSFYYPAAIKIEFLMEILVRIIIILIISWWRLYFHSVIVLQSTVQINDNFEFDRRPCYCRKRIYDPCFYVFLYSSSFCERHITLCIRYNNRECIYIEWGLRRRFVSVYIRVYCWNAVYYNYYSKHGYKTRI